MWVTQSYLGNPEPDANLFVYYLFEDYVTEHFQFTSRVQRRLEDLGTMFGPRVSLFSPNERFAAQISGEIRDIDDLWCILAGKLPGVFVSTTPLSQFDISSGDYHFFSLKDLSDDDAAKVIDEVRRVVDEQILSCRKKNTRVVSRSFWNNLYDSIEVKPGYAGIAIDLKKVFDPRFRA